MAKGFGVSPITNTIYYGNKNTKTHTWMGEKKDVTNEAIAAVFEWFIGNMNGVEEYSIHYPSTEYELVMRKRKNDTIS